MITIYIMPYEEIMSLSSLGRIKKILNVAKQNKIVLLQGRLRKEEEVELIKTTMEEINKEFHGIELSVIYPQKNYEINKIQQVKEGMINKILGDRIGLTIVGPSNVVREIKKDPSKIELLMSEENKKQNSKKKKSKKIKIKK